jgi:hypothetical protein
MPLCCCSSSSVTVFSIAAAVVLHSLRSPSQAVEIVGDHNPKRPRGPDFRRSIDHNSTSLCVGLLFQRPDHPASRPRTDPRRRCDLSISRDEPSQPCPPPFGKRKHSAQRLCASRYLQRNGAQNLHQPSQPMNTNRLTTDSIAPETRPDTIPQ